MLRRLVLPLLLACSVGAPVFAQSVRTNAGFKQSSLARNDDGSTGLIQLGFPINFFGRTRTAAYVNNNGNITFDGALSTFTPFGLNGVAREIIAPFFADVDTRNVKSSLVTYGQDTINGHTAFGVNWVNVGYYSIAADKLNSFQLVLIDRSDTGSGNFDIEFNYDQIQWETGDASNGHGGLGGVSASAGWSNGSSLDGTFYQVPGSLVNGAFLDGGPEALVTHAASNKQPGRYLFHARDGAISPGLTILTGCPLPPAIQGQAYRAQFNGTGASSTIGYSLIADPSTPLPNLTFTPAGLLSGTPTTNGDYAFTVQATALDESGDSQTVTKRCSVTVTPAQVQITNACPLPPATIGAGYSATLQATGGPGPYVWSLTDSIAVPGLTLSSSGQLSGTPTAAGMYNLSLQAVSKTDPSVLPAYRTCSIAVSTSQTLLSASCSLPAGTTGVDYKAQLTVSGGSAPYVWSVAGRLPDGLSVSSTGAVTGVPTSATNNQFTAAVTDARGNRATQSCSLAVQSPVLSVSTACPLPSGYAGTPYNAALTVRGGSAPYQWTVAGGLPHGLTLSAQGVVSGTPTDVGSSAFRLEVTDSLGQPTAQACNVSILPGSLFLYSGCPADQGYVGESFNAELVAALGAAPYYYSGSNLPPGLHVASGTPATLAGILTTAGTYNYTLSVQDRSGKSTSTTCRLTVATQSKPSITSACPLPGGSLGTAYSTTLAASGGAQPYSFRAAGSLPSGLTLGTNGQLSGTPLSAGVYPFTIQVTDGVNQVSTQNCSVAVAAPPLPSLALGAMNSNYAPAGTGPQVKLTLSKPYTADVRGTLQLTTVPTTNGSTPEVNVADPRVKFANGQSTMVFTIPAGSTTFSTSVPSTGTVASDNTITVSGLQAGRDTINIVPEPKTFGISPGAPVITTACWTPTALTVTGYSTTRSLTTAVVTAGGTARTLDVSGVAAGYFTDAASIRFGGTFTLAFPYAVPSGVSTVNVQLTNSAGASAVRAASRCQ